MPAIKTAKAGPANHMNILRLVDINGISVTVTDNDYQIAAQTAADAWAIARKNVKPALADQ